MKTIISLLILLFAQSFVNAQNPLQVDETLTQGFLRDDRLQILLSVENRSKKTDVFVRLELISVGDKVLETVFATHSVEKGRNGIFVEIPFESKNVSDKSIWTRLGYTISASKDKDVGILSLSEIMPELFEINASSGDDIYPGMVFPVRVRTLHPTKFHKVSDVKLNGELKVEIEKDGKPEDLIVKAEGETDKDGLGILKFKIPDNLNFVSTYNAAELEITGEKNGLKNSTQEEISSRNDETFFYITADKPLYQPNQKIYIRSLVLNNKNANDSRRVAADKDITFKISDEEDTVLYRENVKTSRFGIAAIEWQIPDNAKLGSYRINVSDIAGDNESNLKFKVSRYELPNFIVKTKTDKDFYLPEDKTAKVKINADYLFGKSVAMGKVKIVRESEREWNYSKQKWDVDEEETYEGETNNEGEYEAEIPLSKHHTELTEDDYDKFEDLKFTAYFTDLTTNITEERRFDLRVSKEAIHLYVIGSGFDDLNNKLPIKIFVTTSSADGKPLATDFEIKGKYDNDSGKGLKTLGKFETNKYGVAKVKFKLPKCGEYCYEDLILKISARDSENRIGTYETNDITVDEDNKKILIGTNKAIYKKGDPIIVDLLSSEKNEIVYLDVKRSYTNIISSHAIKLRNGRAKLKIPYDQSFDGSLNVIGYFNDGDNDAVKDSVGIIFPKATNLDVKLLSDKETYRPAEEATLKFQVNSPDKTTDENALGVFMLDKAVEERALNDNNFGGAFDPFAYFRGLLGQKAFGGVTENDLQKLDLSSPISKDLQLVAEVMFTNFYSEPNFYGNEYEKRLADVFGKEISVQFEPIEAALKKEFEKSHRHPTDEESLKKILEEKNLNLEELRDPWGNKYVATFYPEGIYNVVKITSYGANKRPDDYDGKVFDDDLTTLYERFEYFKETENLLDIAVNEYFVKTGEFIRNEETLGKAMAEQNLNLDELKDRWGKAYRVEFGVTGTDYTISLKTGGKDKKFDKETYGNDFVIWTAKTSYFEKNRLRIQEILREYVRKEKTYPRTEREYKEVLRNGGVDFDSLRDGWGQPFYIEIEITNRLADSVKIESIRKLGEEPRDKYVITPVSQEIVKFSIRSLGEDGKKIENYSDGNPLIARFVGIASEQTKDDDKAKLVAPKTILTNGNSLVYGKIVDKDDSVIPNAEIILQNKDETAEQKATANESGAFLFQNIPLGTYSLAVSADGFMRMLVTEISVKENNYVEVNVTLQVGGLGANVQVVGNRVVSIDTVDANFDTNISRTIIDFGIAVPKRVSGGVVNLESFQIDEAGSSASIFVIDGQEVTNFSSGTLNSINYVGEKEPDASTSQRTKETPRVRNYFPETLLWLPEIITTADGKASFKFKLADNITTWKIYAIASNLEGNVGVVEKEVKTFQPFFLDLLPPRILTKDDEIFLPVQVRNYTEKQQKVDVEMTKANWFSSLNSAKRNIEVSANATENAVFGFRADKIIDEGFQKVTAIADKESDAIEKAVTVKPNGKEIIQKETEIFTDSTTFDINFPANTLPETRQAELKIYPNLFAHVAESVEGLLKRPYGCGEQTVSSTYPNLMILKFTKKDNRLRPFAEKYLQKGYERLLGYQLEDGGFSYWGGDDKADIALTAYAIRFLSDAREFIAVDETVIENARDWLIQQQRKDGSWTTIHRMESAENMRRTWQISTYVARSLATAKIGNAEKTKEVKTALAKAFEYLKRRNAEIDDPYALANLGLALIDARKFDEAQKLAEKLKQMAIAAGNGVYWKLETNTPFYGSGTAARIETTALVVQFLTKNKAKKTKTKDLILKGTQFLLKNKDRYGVWHSTQTTINVLEAFLALLPRAKNNSKTETKRIAEIFVNGQKVEDLKLPSENELGYPLTLKLSKSLAPQNNNVEVKINGNNVSTMAQVVGEHYIPWQDFAVENSNTNRSRRIKLEYNCDKQKAKPTEEISCGVNVERIGFNGYGMLLAEIGIPPGADVDRASLEKAKKDDWSFSRYEVLPDRIIVYMWSKAGGTNFKFKFKPRYRINAQTPASFVYDYYNEEAKATIAPLRFEVK